MMTFSKMNPEVKKLWVDALRSGKFKQARNTLKLDGGYCCLGVLCEISPFEERQTETGVSFWGSTSPNYDSPATGVLSWEVQAWAGLDDYNPLIGFINGVPAPASFFNDVEGKSFDEIADLIEENL